MTLKQARILSSETDNTIKQEQNTNVNINIKPSTKSRPQTVPLYPNVPPLNPNVNFTQANQPMDTCLLYTSPSPRDPKTSRMPSSA